MKILYISNLLARNTSGPAYSVPASIKAQSKLDDVYWLDINNTSLPQWEEMKEYHRIPKRNKLSLNILPQEFQKPDIVVFEQVYCIYFVRFAKELLKNKIPYIIIPRCSLTYLAQKKERVKKIIANFLFFNNFIKKSNAIQYLTEKEYIDSKEQFENKYFILPNGFSNIDKIEKKIWDNAETLNGIYIGRLDIFHKGLDLLINACKEIKDVLINHNVNIRLYGSASSNQNRILDELINKSDLNSIISINPPVFNKDKVNVCMEADFFIMTSRFEGLSMGMIEALSYGLPIVASEGTNMKDIIERYNAGWGCETDKDSIKNTLIKLISEKDLLKQKSNNAIQLSKKYDWGIIASEFHNIIEGITK